jgi:hypothetical protein
MNCPACGCSALITTDPDTGVRYYDNHVEQLPTSPWWVDDMAPLALLQTRLCSASGRALPTAGEK